MMGCTFNMQVFLFPFILHDPRKRLDVDQCKPSHINLKAKFEILSFSRMSVRNKKNVNIKFLTKQNKYKEISRVEFLTAP